MNWAGKRIRQSFSMGVSCHGIMGILRYISPQSLELLSGAWKANTYILQNYHFSMREEVKIVEKHLVRDTGHSQKTVAGRAAKQLNVCLPEGM